MATKLPVKVTVHYDHNGHMEYITRTIGKETINFPIHGMSVNSIKPADGYQNWKDTTLDASIQMQDKILDYQSKKIKDINNEISKKQKDQDTIDEELKKLGYQKTVDAINSQNKTISDLQKKYDNAKASDKKKIKKQLDNAKKSLSDLKKSLSKISGKAGSLLKRKNADTDYINNLNKSLKTWKKKHTEHTNKKNAYKKQLQKNKEKAHADKVKKAQNSIKKKIEKRAKEFGKPKSPIYGYDSTSDKVVFLFDTEVSETRSSTGTQNSVDKGDPIMDHSALSTMTVTITAKLMSETMHDLNEQYNTLKEWQKNQVVTFKGEIYWAHSMITDLSKTYSTPATITNNKDYNGHSFSLNISITLTYVKFAKVKFTKAKGKKSTSSSGKKGPSKKTGTYITVKYGMTYWGLAQKYHTTVAQLRKWNGSENVTMYPDKKTGKYPKKLRVK